LMTATYWLVGRRIVEHEQKGAARAGYGDELIRRLSTDLSKRFGRGFARSNLFQMRAFYLAYRDLASIESSPRGERNEKVQTPSGPSASAAGSGKVQTASGLSGLAALATRFPLPWSHYVRLLAVHKREARAFYEAETIRGGWTVRQLTRQIDSQFYERALLSKSKAALIRKGAVARHEDVPTPEEEVKDPYVLEFLGLKDEYSEGDLEDALIAQLESFLLELGGDFAFIGR